MPNPDTGTARNTQPQVVWYYTTAVICPSGERITDMQTHDSMEDAWNSVNDNLVNEDGNECGYRVEIESVLAEDAFPE